MSPVQQSAVDIDMELVHCLKTSCTNIKSSPVFMQNWGGCCTVSRTRSELGQSLNNSVSAVQKFWVDEVAVHTGRQERQN